jgi:NNP family nitrate/nitrite transporter-like MFS transporter
LVSLYFVSFGGFLALTTWLPTFWRLGHGMDLRSAAVLTALGFTLLASFVRAGGGRPADKYGGENIALVGFLMVLVGALVMVFTSSFWFDVVGEVILAVGMGVGNASVFKLVARYVPEAVGGASGWVGGLGAFGGFAIPPILGYFVDSYGKSGYAFGFAVYGVLAVLAVLVTLTLRSRPPRKSGGTS